MNMYYFSGIILFFLAIGSWIMATRYSDEFNNIEYGELIYIGQEIRDIGEKVCYEHSHETMLCCISHQDNWNYGIELCHHLPAHILCKPTNNSNDRPEDKCPYFGPNGFDLSARYIKCEIDKCIKGYELYNICYVYKYNNKIFYHCDSRKLSQVNETQTPSLKPGNYSSFHIVNNTIYAFGYGYDELKININVSDIVHKKHVFEILSAIFFFSGVALYIRSITPQKIIKQSTNYGSLYTV